MWRGRTLGTTVLLALATAGPAAAAPGPALSVSADAVRAATTCRAAAVPRPGHQPVLLVHGAFGTAEESFAGGLLDALPAKGFDTCAVTVPARSLGALAPTAEWVVTAVRQLQARRGGRVDVVSHSQGAVLTRWATRWWPDVGAIVDDHVSLAGPVGGSALSGALCSGFPCPTSTYAVAAGSRTLRALNTPAPLAPAVDATAITTDFDELVQPPSSAQYAEDEEGAATASVQELCPGRVVTHFGLLFDPVVRAIVTDALVRPGPGAPGAVRVACGEPLAPGPGFDTLLRNLAGTAEQLARDGSPSGEPPLPDYVAASPDRFGAIDVEVTPRQLRRTRLKRTLRFVVRTGGVPLRRATVTFGDDEVTTDGAGRAQLNYKPERAGTRQVRAEATGYAGDRAALRILRPRRR